MVMEIWNEMREMSYAEGQAEGYARGYGEAYGQSFGYGYERGFNKGMEDGKRIERDTIAMRMILAKEFSDATIRELCKVSEEHLQELKPSIMV